MLPDGWMTAWSLGGWTLAGILVMAAATYLVRAGGFWIIQRVEPPAAVERALSYLPGSVFAALVAPPILAGGPPEWAGALVMAAMALRGAGMPLSLAAAVATVALLRMIPGL